MTPRNGFRARVLSTLAVRSERDNTREYLEGEPELAYSHA